jgi:TRAP-type C4-dicarboxylate transport system permease small subunit
MNRAQLLNVVNALLGVSVSVQIVTGVFRDVLPPAVFLAVHPVNGYVFAVLAITHIYLNWNWIRMTFFTRRKV